MTQDEYHQFIEQQVSALRITYDWILNRGEGKEIFYGTSDGMARRTRCHRE